MADFEDILSRPAQEIEKPKPRPVGMYQAVLIGLPSKRDFESKAGEEMKTLEFKVKLQSAGPDVDQEALAEHPDVSTWPSLVYTVFYQSPEGQFALRQFLAQTLGIDESGGRTLGEMISESPGKQLNVILFHEPYQAKDGTNQIATRIKSVAAL